MKKIILALFVLALFQTTASAEYQEINNGESGLSVRTKINNMHEELYAPDTVQLTPQGTPPAQSEGLFYYDDVLKTYVFYNDITGSSLSVGRELWARSHNNTGETIDDGSVVYISGVDSDNIEISLVQPDEFDKSRLIGVVTGDILNGAVGETTSYGKVSGINTSGLSLGVVYAEHDGTLTSTSPTEAHFTIIVGTCLEVSATTGVIFVNPYVSSTAVEVTDTNGFANRTSTAVSFADGTRTLSIAPTDTHFHYYIEGKSTKRETTDTVVITDVEGLHVIYYDDSAGTLVATANPNAGQVGTVIRTKAIVAYIYWNATDDESYYFADERHGISMSPETHTYIHFTRGAQYLSGLGASNVEAHEDGSLDAHAQFGIDGGFTADEDLITVSSTIASTVGLPIYYLDGTTANLRKAELSGFSVLTDVAAGTGATGRLVYNGAVVDDWQLLTVDDTDFVLCHTFQINGFDGEDQQIAVIGQASYDKKNDARDAASTEISSIVTGFPFEEAVPLQTFIFEVRDSYTNSVNARIEEVSGSEDYIDWRTTELAQGVAASSHANLTNLQLAADTVTWGHIDDQAQTIAGEKTFSDNVITTGDVQQQAAVVTEIATPATPSSGLSKIYSKTDNQLYFLNDLGEEILISGAAAVWGSITGTLSDQTDLQSAIDAKGNVFKVNTPADDQVGVWTGDGTIEGDTDLTFDGSNLAVGGVLTATGGLQTGATTTPTVGFKASGSLDADQTVAQIQASVTTPTAGAVVSDVAVRYKDGSDASGAFTDAFVIDGSENQVEFAINTTLPAGDIVADELADTAVTPGSYTAADITVDQQGRITAAANGSGGGASVTIQSADPTVGDATGLYISTGTTKFWYRDDPNGVYDFGTYTFTADPATLTSATIPSAGTTISLLFSEAMTIGSGGNGGWTLNTPTNAMTYSSGDTTSTLIYTLASTIESSDTPTVSYTQPGDGLENGAGDDLASIVEAAVVNNSTQETCAGGATGALGESGASAGSGSTVCTGTCPDNVVYYSEFVAGPSNDGETSYAHGELEAVGQSVRMGIWETDGTLLASCAEFEGSDTSSEEVHKALIADHCLVNGTTYRLGIWIEADAWASVHFAGTFGANSMSRLVMPTFGDMSGTPAVESANFTIRMTVNTTPGAF